MTINATKYRLTPDRIPAGTRGSYGVEKLSFDFSADWDGLLIYVVFYPGRGKPVKVPYLPGVEIDIPAEVMRTSGESRFIVSGVRIGDDGEVEKKILTLEGHIDVLYTPDDKGGNARKVTPDTYDLFLEEAQEYMEDALEEAKKSGEFDGPPGPALTYDDLTDEQKEELHGEPGSSGVFVKEDAGDEPEESDNVMVDMTDEADDPEIWIPDSLVREGNFVWMMCDGEKVGEPFEIIDGMDGKDGTDGKNFTILGYYDTLDALREAVPEPEPGDAYGIGTETPYNAWVFDGVTLDWIDNGPLSGVAGADGVGIKSIEQTTVSDEDGGTNVITITMTDSTTYTFGVKNGSKGSAGYTPQKGVDYFDGEDGKDGEDGYTPVRGTDYWTEEDQQTIVNEVLANFTDATEVAM